MCVCVCVGVCVHVHVSVPSVGLRTRTVLSEGQLGTHRSPPRRPGQPAPSFAAPLTLAGGEQQPGLGPHHVQHDGRALTQQHAFHPKLVAGGRAGAQVLRGWGLPTPPRPGPLSPGTFWGQAPGGTRQDGVGGWQALQTSTQVPRMRAAAPLQAPLPSRTAESMSRAHGRAWLACTRPQGPARCLFSTPPPPAWKKSPAPQEPRG